MLKKIVTTVLLSLLVSANAFAAAQTQTLSTPGVV
jgi:hypothetical protein